MALNANSLTGAPSARPLGERPLVALHIAASCVTHSREAVVAAWITRGQPWLLDDNSHDPARRHWAALGGPVRAIEDHLRAIADPADPAGAATARNELHSALSADLLDGLKKRVGFHLTTADRAFVELCRQHAVLIRPPCGPRVCERCGVVFEARRSHARACQACHARRFPPLRPWHLAGTFGGPFDPSTYELRYWGECECGERFEATDARTRYCSSCGSPAGRVRRHRLASILRVPPHATTPREHA